MTEFSQTLKSWRSARRLSQLDLALEAEISPRHLSFLETGRANPSREMVVRLGEAMQLPLHARNQMLTHAGFAIRYRSRSRDDQDMAPIRRAISRQLACHMPYPGLALDRLWNVSEANPAARTLLAPFGVGEGDSLLELVLSGAMASAVENWPEVAHHLLLRLRTESAGQGGVPEFEAAIRHLTAASRGHEAAVAPVVPTILRQGDVRLSLFSTIAQFGTPEDLLLDDLKIELFYPMDDETARAFEAMARP